MVIPLSPIENSKWLSGSPAMTSRFRSANIEEPGWQHQRFLNIDCLIKKGLEPFVCFHVVASDQIAVMSWNRDFREKNWYGCKI
jgi:hypothetical protein